MCTILGQGQSLATRPPVRVTEDFLGFAPAIKACDVCWNKYYSILGISEGMGCYGSNLVDSWLVIQNQIQTLRFMFHISSVCYDNSFPNFPVL